MAYWEMKSSNLFSVVTDFLKFIYRPDCKKVDDFFAVKIQKLLLLFLIVLVIRVILISMGEFFISTSFKKDISQPDLKILLLSCSLVPVLEEIAFRLPLLFSSINLSLSTSILSFFLINRFFLVDNHYDIGNYFFLRALMALIIGAIVWFMSKKYAYNLKLFYSRKLCLIVYGYSLIFALMHIGNYEMKSNFLIASVWLVLPHIAAGLLYSFVRVKYGFFYSLSIHVINNLIPVIAFFFI
ncbi:CPBP family glutamic-type intramembrane protease [Chryseobacterium jejuense]|uniref:CAAX protease self-immunity n=1 Tax=Chryseobacterium jejuense TaxID=445960 RepID=A0ABY0QBT9_CHRJE|nr:CPBP family glutamic-type intramembrane protease [Chryseobacterium jejuense]SDJ88030.1 CAAX protease self-immunity [Chryseobacterium jejuense]